MDDMEEIIDRFYARIDEVERMYEELAEELGVVLTDPMKQHEEILARAKACRAAHDGLFRRAEIGVHI
jgi:uncharacterized protein Yka (UPF0111/DUF47 family)